MSCAWQATMSTETSGSKSPRRDNGIVAVRPVTTSAVHGRWMKKQKVGRPATGLSRLVSLLMFGLSWVGVASSLLPPPPSRVPDPKPQMRGSRLLGPRRARDQRSAGDRRVHALH